MSIPGGTMNIYSKICLANLCSFVEMLFEINYREIAFSWYESANHLTDEYGHAILIAVHLILIVRHFARSRYHKLQCRQLTADLREERKAYREKSSAMDRKAKENREMKERLTSFQEQHNAHATMNAGIQFLAETTKILSDLSEDWQKSQVNVLQAQISDMEQKNKDIEAIMIDGLYNDPKYLAYEGDEWTFTALAKKADEMKIPRLTWGGKATLSYILRTVEQLTKIGDIIEPVYPDGYETEEWPDSQEEEEEDSEDEDDYLDDPEWMPTCTEELDSDEEEDWENKEIDAESLLTTMVTLARSSEKKCYFFETPKSKELEKLIKLNGLSCSFEKYPSPGYNLTGYSIHRNMVGVV